MVHMGAFERFCEINPTHQQKHVAHPHAVLEKLSDDDAINISNIGSSLDMPAHFDGAMTEVTVVAIERVNPKCWRKWSISVCFDIDPKSWLVENRLID